MKDPSQELDEFKRLADAALLDVTKVYQSIPRPSRELTKVALRLCSRSGVLPLYRVIDKPDVELTQIAFERCVDSDLQNLMAAIENPTPSMISRTPPAARPTPWP